MMDMKRLEQAREKARRDMGGEKADELAERREEGELEKALNTYRQVDPDWYRMVSMLIKKMQLDQKIPESKMTRVQKELALRHVGQMRRLLLQKGIRWNAGG